MSAYFSKNDPIMMKFDKLNQIVTMIKIFEKYSNFQIQDGGLSDTTLENTGFGHNSAADRTDAILENIFLAIITQQFLTFCPISTKFCTKMLVAISDHSYGRT